MKEGGKKRRGGGSRAYLVSRGEEKKSRIITCGLQQERKRKRNFPEKNQRAHCQLITGGKGFKQGKRGEKRGVERGTPGT